MLIFFKISHKKEIISFSKFITKENTKLKKHLKIVGVLNKFIRAT